MKKIDENVEEASIFFSRETKEPFDIQSLMFSLWGQTTKDFLMLLMMIRFSHQALTLMEGEMRKCMFFHEDFSCLATGISAFC